MDMKYGQVAENAKIDKAIYDCFDFLNEKEQRKFVKKFKEQPHSKIQIMHTFSELLLGAYLSANGFIVENDRKIGAKTPDWSIYNTSLDIVAIVEMVYHHIDNKTNGDILDQLKEGKKFLAYFPNGNDPEYNRLYSQIQDKASKYKDLVAEIKVPYVVAVFIDFTAAIDVQKTRDCMMSGDEPLFKLYPDLSGVLHFEEANRGSYCFSFIENLYALRKMDIPSGYFNKALVRCGCFFTTPLFVPITHTARTKSYL